MVNPYKCAPIALFPSIPTGKEYARNEWLKTSVGDFYFCSGENKRPAGVYYKGQTGRIHNLSDISLIPGIGPVFLKQLFNAGIFSITQLAEQIDGADQAKEFLNNLFTNPRAGKPVPNYKGAEANRPQVAKFNMFAIENAQMAISAIANNEFERYILSTSQKGLSRLDGKIFTLAARRNYDGAAGVCKRVTIRLDKEAMILKAAIPFTPLPDLLHDSSAQLLLEPPHKRVKLGDDFRGLQALLGVPPKLDLNDHYNEYNNTIDNDDINSRVSPTGALVDADLVPADPNSALIEIPKLPDVFHFGDYDDDTVDVLSIGSISP
jgi:hypothetical protein